MDRIRLIFLIIGSTFFGLGMIWAGMLSWADNRLAGLLYIIAAAVIITMCALVFAHEKGKGKGR